MAETQYEIIATKNGFIVRPPMGLNCAIEYSIWATFESFEAASKYLRDAFGKTHPLDKPKPRNSSYKP